MKLVLAGNQREYEKWIRDHGLTKRDAPAISKPDSIRGLTLRPGDVIKVGTWYERSDLGEIEQNIYLSTHH